MSNLKAFIYTLILLAGLSCEQKLNSFDFQYESVENDPTQTRIYTLDNGLKVYISINKDEPRIQTNIAVKAGSKYDPAECTGLAHYLEHMLFKGNSEYGTNSWEEEKLVLDQISDLFELHRETADSLKKIEYYNQIDSLSLIASELCLSNEYDKMATSIGASGTNAYTSNERTVYINEIPSNELEKWLKLESSRFSELVLRLFHTELETVYEEFNRGQDNDFNQLFFKMYKNLYPNHPYGTQTTIGKGEHLKNPSMERIHEYFNTYYVPNNMCIALSGDLDYTSTITLINKYFGEFKPKTVPKFESPKVPNIVEPILDSLFGPQQEAVALAYKFPGVKTEEIKILDIIDEILSNGKAGLIDLNIMQKQKALNAGSGLRSGIDYSSFFMYGLPKEGQTLDEVSKLLFEQVEIIKKGDFDDWLIEAIINNKELRETRSMESNRTRVGNMVESFISDIPWADFTSYNNELRKITKSDVVEFANKYFGSNYVQIKKLQGINESLHKVVKPEITPINIKREEKSAFYAEFDSMKSEKITPLFVDYKSVLKVDTLENKLPYTFIKNETNDLFQLVYLMDFGTDNNRLLGLALSYLPYLGTDQYSAEDLQKEFFKLGLDFQASSSRDKVYVTLSGIRSSMERGIELLEHIMNNVQKDENALQELINDILKSRANSKLDKRQILFSGLMSYAKYGPKSPFTNILSQEELMNIESDTLIALIKSVFEFKHRAFIYSKDNNDLALVSKMHKVSPVEAELGEGIDFKEMSQEQNKVLFAHYDMVQTEIILISKDQQGLDLAILPEAYIFNEYFGSGLSSIVFQEIRESKALAYSAYCRYSVPSKKENANYVFAYLGTQADKLSDAVNALTELMNDMPQAQLQFEQAKTSALKNIASSRITKTSVFWNYEKLKKLGIDYDYREDIYNEIEKMTLEDLNRFFDNHIKGKKFTFGVIGDKNKVDFNALEKLGTVEEIELEAIFGY